MPMTPKAEKDYKPRRPDVTLDDVITPAERKRREQDVQEAKDAANQSKLEEAYMGSLTSTEASKKAKGGFLTATKKGGAVSASKRADGIAQRGKTRGKVL